MLDICVHYIIHTRVAKYNCRWNTAIAKKRQTKTGRDDRVSVVCTFAKRTQPPGGTRAHQDPASPPIELCACILTPQRSHHSAQTPDTYTTNTSCNPHPQLSPLTFPHGSQLPRIHEVRRCHTQKPQSGPPFNVVAVAGWCLAGGQG